MSKNENTSENWDNRTLGNEEEYAQPANKELTKQIDDSIGLQMISIRLDKSLIDTLKILAEYHKMGYQPLIRESLKRFAEGEMKQIAIKQMNRTIEKRKKSNTNIAA